MTNLNTKANYRSWCDFLFSQNNLDLQKFLQLSILFQKRATFQRWFLSRVLTVSLRRHPLPSEVGKKYTFFYKHLVYKEAQPQILEKFKHSAKHAPGWDFWYEKKNLMNFWKYTNFLDIFWWNFRKASGDVELRIILFLIS